MRRILSLGLAGLMTMALGGRAALAHNEGLPPAPLENRNMAHVYNLPQHTSANAIAFFQRKNADGTVGTYVIVASAGNGFDIVNVTDPSHAAVVGRYLLDGPPTGGAGAVQNSSLGVNYHAWVDVNPRRNIVALSVEEPGFTVRTGTTRTVTFVDISDLANPRFLGNAILPQTPDGPHTIRMIGDNHVYTSLSTYIIDYTNPRDPKSSLAPAAIQGHEFYEDPNRPGIVYAGVAGQGAGFKILDVTNPAAPRVIHHKPDGSILNSHEVYPAPDSSYVGIGDFKQGQSELQCPGGGIHFYDISGKYKPGASLTNPIKMGVYHIPFAGLPTPTGPNYTSCTMHSWQMQPERELALAGMYAAGTYVLDPSKAKLASGGAYTEAATTTWGNTLANNRDAGDYVNATQWLPFDLANPEHERYVFVSGSARGLDIYRYSGAMPKKMARLTVNGSASGGIVRGKLERYAVLTPTGWKNLPISSETLQISAAGQTVHTTTALDGTFSAQLALPAGSTQVTVTWAGDDTFRGETTTATVTA